MTTQHSVKFADGEVVQEETKRFVDGQEEEEEERDEQNYEEDAQRKFGQLVEEQGGVLVEEAESITSPTNEVANQEV